MTSVRFYGSPQKLNRMQQIPIQANGTRIDIALSVKYLALTLNQSISWKDHVHAISLMHEDKSNDGPH